MIITQPNFLVLKNIFLFIIILFILNSCENKKITFVYSDMYFDGDKFPTGAYRLSSKGSCIYYKYNNYTGERNLWDVDDVIESTTFNFKLNGLITICGWKYKLIKIKSDTLFLWSISDERIEKIVKSKNQKDNS